MGIGTVFGLIAYIGLVRSGVVTRYAERDIDDDDDGDTTTAGG